MTLDRDQERIGRVNDQLERAPVAQPNRREVPDISGCEATDAEAEIAVAMSWLEAANEGPR